jgi:hypothetical protein
MYTDSTHKMIFFKIKQYRVLPTEVTLSVFLTQPNNIVYFRLNSTSSCSLESTLQYLVLQTQLKYIVHSRFSPIISSTTDLSIYWALDIKSFNKLCNALAAFLHYSINLSIFIHNILTFICWDIPIIAQLADSHRPEAKQVTEVTLAWYPVKQVTVALAPYVVFFGSTSVTLPADIGGSWPQSTNSSQIILSSISNMTVGSCVWWILHNTLICNLTLE